MANEQKNVWETAPRRSARHSSGTGGDARQTGATWRHKRDAKAGLTTEDAWTGIARYRCDACGALIRVAPEQWGTTVRCGCKNPIRLPRRPPEVLPAPIHPGRSRLWIVGVVLAGVSALALTAFVIHEGWQKPHAPTAVTTPTSDRVDFDDATLQRVLEGFFTARTWREQLAFIREPDIVYEKMEAWHRLHPHFQCESVTVGKSALVDYGGAPCVVARIRLHPGGETMVAAFERTEEGPFLDWETLVGYQPVPVDTFLDGGLQPTPFRFFVHPGDYYNGEYTERLHRSWRLVEAIGGPVLWGYTLRTDPAHADIVSAMGRRTFTRGAVTIESPATPGLNQVRIIAFEKGYIPNYDSSGAEPSPGRKD